MYTIPEQYLYRLHHVRPRFKNNIESVLLDMAAEICALGELNPEDMKEGLNRAIKRFPGNSSRAQKTIDNWRTEITSLLGLMEHTSLETVKPSALANTLNDTQDLIQFFRFFCLRFQYPGGHLKPDKTLEMIKQGVKFKPAKYIILLLEEGRSLINDNFGISKEEATHCIFNDLRVTRGLRTPKETAQLILRNKEANKSYQGGGDLIRYAGDILDYMELANLVSRRPNGDYYLKTYEYEAIHAIKSSSDYFPGYDALYSKNTTTLQDVSETQDQWFSYVNQGVDPSLFQTDVYSLLVGTNEDSDDDSAALHKKETAKALADFIAEVQDPSKSITTKKIGDCGEAISIEHEKNRLTELGYEHLATLVTKIEESKSVGYDIKSYEGIGQRQRLIEVKTTVSKNKLYTHRFQMTPNEWGAAESFGDVYFIYRLMIYDGNITLFIIQNPIKAYKADKLAIIPRKGAEIIFDDDSGVYEEILL